jgi:leucyl/phenylalanyl-tRNA---protein transferase
MKPNQRILAQLGPENLIYAYSHGAFPMVEQGQLLWFSPDPRGLMPLDERFHVSRSLAATIRRGRYVCTVDRRFASIIELCARRPEGTWISSEVNLAYRHLHDLGLAHSVEAWPRDQVEQGEPVGGLYGVALGGAFFAESMFHTATDAGKVAVAFLIERLREQGFVLCDIQWTTPNLTRFGAFDMPREEYLRLLVKALALDCTFACNA